MFWCACSDAMPRQRRASFCLFLLLLFSPPAVQALPLQSAATPVATSKAAQAQDEWDGMYVQQGDAGYAKVGYAHISTTPTIYLGKPALREVSHTTLQIAMLGTKVKMVENSEAITDLKSQPLTETIDVESNGSAIHLVAVFDYAAHKIYCTSGSGADAVKTTLDIPEGANLAIDPSFATEGHPLTVGDKFDVYTLSPPPNLELEPIHIEVTGKAEIVNDAGKKVPTFITKEVLTVGESTEWIDSAGNAIKGTLSVGPLLQLVTTHENKEHALNPAFLSPILKSKSAPAYAPPTDFAVATSVRVEKTIEDPRRLRSLQATLSGIPDAKLILSDARQKETRLAPDQPPYSVALEANVETVDPAASARLPITDAAVAPYLQKAAYLNIEDEAIRKTALQIRGQETNSYKVALAIRDWVHQNMTPDASIALPRSATDIYGRRRGVCRDYATLYAALARAAGIPTRLCAGIVYVGPDAISTPGFYYHAWDEVYVGQWVAIDPTLYDSTLGVDYVDATHIKFAQGDVTDMYQAVNVVGKLKIDLK